MKVENTAIPEVKIIHLDAFSDDRGFFVERFKDAWIKDFAPGLDFVQDNFSKSIPGVIRGLHGQRNPDQAKLVTVTRGKIFDVAVDARPQSPTVGKWVAVELSGDEPKSLYIPAGFLHGFCVLGNEPADVLYKVTGYYNKTGEFGCRYDDKDLGIFWPVDGKTVSERDLQMPSFEALLRTLLNGV